MWTDAALENWRLRQRVELSRPWPTAVGVDRQYQEADAGAGPAPGGDDRRSPPNPSPYERVQSGNGVVRLKRKPVKADLAPLSDDGVDDLWRD